MGFIFQFCACATVFLKSVFIMFFVVSMIVFVMSCEVFSQLYHFKVAISELCISEFCCVMSEFKWKISELRKLNWVLRMSISKLQISSDLFLN